jgi:hypothetical protein
MFQGAKQNEESLLPPGEGHASRDGGGRPRREQAVEDEGIINGKLHDPLTPTLSLREREPSGKYPEKLICRSSSARSTHHDLFNVRFGPGDQAHKIWRQLHIMWLR